MCVCVRARACLFARGVLCLVVCGHAFTVAVCLAGAWIVFICQVVSRSALSDFEDFAEVALSRQLQAGAGDFEKAWHHEYIQGIISKRGVGSTD